MKIAVYTIAKNEEQFVDVWAKSTEQADYRLIADTGSADKTVELALSKHISTIDICISPWRFDDARNASLSALPKDIDVCIALDMDEQLQPGWREELEKSWTEHTDRLRYNYVWSWEGDKPGLTYYGDKIHKRHGFRWVHPVHEVLKKDLRLTKEIQTYTNFTMIHHYPDNTKSRSSYLDLLALSVKENPYDDRNAHYYARDLMFAKRYDEAIKEFKRHLDLPTAVWLSERSASYRYIGDCLWATSRYNEAISYFELAINLTPNEREGYVALAQAHKALGNHQLVIDNCVKALAITVRPNSYINQPWAWGTWPQQMLDEAKCLIRSVAVG